MDDSGGFKRALEFLKQHKKYWAMPIIIILLLLGLCMYSAQHSMVAQFIYSKF